MYPNPPPPTGQWRWSRASRSCPSSRSHNLDKISRAKPASNARPRSSLIQVVTPKILPKANFVFSYVIQQSAYIDYEIKMVGNYQIAYV